MKIPEPESRTTSSLLTAALSLPFPNFSWTWTTSTATRTTWHPTRSTCPAVGFHWTGTRERIDVGLWRTATACSSRVSARASPRSRPTTDLHVSSSRQTVGWALDTVRQLVGSDLHAEDRGRRFRRNLGRLDPDGRPGLFSIHVTPDFGRPPRVSLVEGTKVHVPVRISPRGVASQGRLLSPAPGSRRRGLQSPIEFHFPTSS